MTTFLAEDKLTKGQKFVPQNARGLYDEEAVLFARKHRMERLPFDKGDEPACVVLDYKLAGRDKKRGSEFTVMLRYKGAMLATRFTLGWGYLDPPEFRVVLHCLLMDISGIEDHTFETWCSDFGLDADSRQAEKTFNACRDTLPRVRRLLGADFDEIRALDEDTLFERFQNVKTFQAKAGVTPPYGGKE